MIYEFYCHYGKRLLDIVFAILVFFILSPLLLIVAILVWLKLGSPIMFRQQRPGLHGQLFKILKFRTMFDYCDEKGCLLLDEERLNRLGKFLRSTSLDELPELLNVLKGQMSLVGPRPLMIQYLERYTQEQMRRHEVKPGITGWAQVKGRNAISWEERFEYDVWYVDHKSLWLDLKIIALTVWKILKREGICQEGHATMPEFRGTQHSS